MNAPGGAARFRSLHPVHIYDGLTAEDDVVARTADGAACWYWAAGSDVLVVGTSVGADLIRWRQGDPARVATRQTEVLWGIAGERPNYLFDAQREGIDAWDRPADWCALALAQTIATRMGATLPPLLPNAAPGAVVVTGDDDQAFLEKYDEQLRRLGDVPVTYFLHPLTRHTLTTLRAAAKGRHLELGLHPDALDAPHRYAPLFGEQARWFRDVTGEPPRLVRNHGYLNDGYWGHLPVWLEHRVRGSANVPGVDGAVMNGSLLPARMAWDDELTPHWSILTAIGDGVRFALGMSGPESAQCVQALAARIVASRVPGVIVLNLHPQNVAETVDMHRAVHDLCAEGFIAMTLGQCLDWFAGRDRVVAA